MNENAAPPASPCVKICVVDPNSGFCIGCGRTVAEISLWPEMSIFDRRHVLDLLPKRLKDQRSRTVRGGRAREGSRARPPSPWA